MPGAPHQLLPPWILHQSSHPAPGTRSRVAGETASPMVRGMPGCLGVPRQDAVT